MAALELKQLREEDRLSPVLVFRDPCLLDFLGLKDSYVEKDLEAAILRGLEAVILELGTGFAFLARRSGSPWTGRTSIWTCCFSHARR